MTTVTIDQDRLLDALRDAACQGMDNTSGPFSGYAETARVIADDILDDLVAGRPVGDEYRSLIEINERKRA